MEGGMDLIFLLVNSSWTNDFKVCIVKRNPLEWINFDDPMSCLYIKPIWHLTIHMWH